MQQIYAKVKKSSKYFWQNELAKQQGTFPFPVTIDAKTTEAYKVKGGPGEQYWLSDLNLYVITDGKELRIK